MPLVNVKLIEGVFDEAQKRDMIEKLTDTMVEIEGENMRGRDLGRGRRGQERRLGHRRQRADDRRRARGQGRGAPPNGYARGHRGARPRGPSSRSMSGLRRAQTVSASRTRSSARASETILLLPPWAIVYSRFWKGQVPYLARHFRVVTFDPARQRPLGPARPSPRSTGRASTAARRAGRARRDRHGRARARRALRRGRARRSCSQPSHPGARPRRAVHVAPRSRSRRPLPERTGFAFDEPRDAYDGWAKANRHYWERDFRDYLEFFFARSFPEPHSTKQIEDAIGWALETTPETLGPTIARPSSTATRFCELLGRVHCPLLVTESDEDH